MYSIQTVEKVFNNYLDFLLLKNKITTIELIKYKFKNYILPFFGKIKINEITEEQYIKFQKELLKLNFSDSFYEQIHIMMNNFYKYLNIIYKIENIPEKIGMIKNSHNYVSRQHKDIWTKKEFKKFIKTIDDPIYHALFNFLFYTGVRKGEALALKITDFKNNYISINKAITKELYNGSRLILKPKTKSSNRLIHIDFFMQLELKRLIKYYIKKYNNFNNEFFLFGGDKPIATTTLERKKNNWCKIAKVKQIRIHDFRHSHATMLYNKKIKPKVIQQRLGHANISTTLNTYVHIGEKEEKRLIKVINLTRL